MNYYFIFMIFSPSILIRMSQIVQNSIIEISRANLYTSKRNINRTPIMKRSIDEPVASKSGFAWEEVQHIRPSLSFVSDSSPLSLSQSPLRKQAFSAFNVCANCFHLMAYVTSIHQTKKTLSHLIFIPFNFVFSFPQAGLVTPDVPDRLLIALEPEAASIYCRKLRLRDCSWAEETRRRSTVSSQMDNRVGDEFRGTFYW